MLQIRVESRNKHTYLGYFSPITSLLNSIVRSTNNRRGDMRKGRGAITSPPSRPLGGAQGSLESPVCLCKCHVGRGNCEEAVAYWDTLMEGLLFYYICNEIATTVRV